MIVTYDSRRITNEPGLSRGCMKRFKKAKEFKESQPVKTTTTAISQRSTITEVGNSTTKDSTTRSISTGSLKPKSKNKNNKTDPK